MKGTPKEHLDRQSVTILAENFCDGGSEMNSQSLLAKNPTLFSTGPQELRDTIILNLDTFIISEQRFYDLRHLAWKLKTIKPLRLFLVWVTIQLNLMLIYGWYEY